MTLSLGGGNASAKKANDASVGDASSSRAIHPSMIAVCSGSLFRNAPGARRRSNCEMNECIGSGIASVSMLTHAR
ncbi:hypothetical protein WL00_28755 [Burkholderia cepacia]|nr:hypothetical protein WL00_28755 [Burkholderia cepacia]KVX72381.1 hypothetical protein WL07_14800 [Burkholderia cepacia]